jgi:hypothetical protein
MEVHQKTGTFEALLLIQTVMVLDRRHRAQRVGADHIRYSGSLFPLSASEYNYQHSVTLVTIAEGRANYEQIPFVRPVPFLRLPATGTMGVADLPFHLAALQLSADLPVEQRPFVQAKLKRDELLVGFREELDRLRGAFSCAHAGAFDFNIYQSDTSGSSGCGNLAQCCRSSAGGTLPPCV